MADKRMIMLYPEMVWTGCTLAINSSMLVNLMGDTIKVHGGDDHAQFFWPLMAMIAFGCGEIVGSFLQGQFVDRFGTQKSLIGLLLIILACAATTLVFNEIHKFTALAFIMSFFWGCNDGAINNHIATLLGFEFPENDLPFGVFNIVQALATIIF